MPMSDQTNIRRKVLGSSSEKERVTTSVIINKGSGAERRLSKDKTLLTEPSLRPASGTKTIKLAQLKVNLDRVSDDRAKVPTILRRKV